MIVLSPCTTTFPSPWDENKWKEFFITMKQGCTSRPAPWGREKVCPAKWKLCPPLPALWKLPKPVGRSGAKLISIHWKSEANHKAGFNLLDDIVKSSVHHTFFSSEKHLVGCKSCCSVGENMFGCFWEILAGWMTGLAWGSAKSRSSSLGCHRRTHPPPPVQHHIIWLHVRGHNS